MYFAFGWPKVFSSEKQLAPDTLPQNVLRIKFSQSGKYIALLTVSTLQIWSGGKHRILLKDYPLDGEPAVELFWISNTEIVISTQQGLLSFYRIVETNVNLLEKLETFSKIKSTNPLRAIELIPYIKLRTVEHSPLSWISRCDVEANYLLITQAGFMQKLHISEKLKPQLLEEIKVQKALSVLPQGENGASALTIRSADVLRSGGVTHIGLVFEEGTAACLSMINETLSQITCKFLVPTLKEKAAQKAIYKNATVISLNMVYSLVAVGYQSGEVGIFKIETGQFERTYSLCNWGIESGDTGAVSALQWSSESRVLAVGYSVRGFSLWSIYGCRLQCSLPHLKLMHQHQREKSFASLSPEHERNGYDNNEPLIHGVSCLTWSPDGYELYFSENNSHKQMLELSFLKNSLSLMNLNYSNVIMLQGTDRLLQLKKRGKDGEFKFHHLQLPRSYIHNNFPVRLVSCSVDGKYFAVAGMRGFLVYTVSMAKWIKFYSYKGTLNFTCLGFCWKSNMIIALVHNLDDDTYEILAYDFLQQVVEQRLKWRQVVPHNASDIPLYLDCNQMNIVVITTGKTVYFYQIIHRIEQFSLSLIFQKQFYTSLPLSIQLLPSLINKSMGEFHLQLLFLLPCGKLCIGDITESKFITTLAEGIEQFWCSNSQLEDVGNTLWAYGANGLTIWFPFFSSKYIDVLSSNPSTPLSTPKSTPTKSTPRANLHNNSVSALEHYEGIKRTQLPLDHAFSFDNEVYPIGFIPEWAVIIGLSQGIVHDDNTKALFFDPQIKVHPFLHSIIQHMLNQKCDSEALNIGLKFRMIPHFDFSLELILHQCLEIVLHSPVTANLNLLSSQRRRDKLRALRIKSKMIPSSPSSPNINTNASSSTAPTTASNSTSASTASTPNPTPTIPSSPAPNSALTTSNSAINPSTLAWDEIRAYQSHYQNQKPPEPAQTRTEDSAADATETDKEKDKLDSAGRPDLLLLSSAGDGSGGALEDEETDDLDLKEKYQLFCSSNNLDNRSQNLIQVLAYLKQFPDHYPTIVVRCARKIDPSIWPLLFLHADNPVDLFNQAIQNCSVGVAASFLRIIEELIGKNESRKSALKVLDVALQQGDSYLVNDLVRFLQPETQL